MKKNKLNLRKKDVIKALSFINPKKPMGTDLFNVVARISVSIALESIILRKSKNNNIEIFLIKRLKNQSYARMWHVPGTILRSGETEKKAFLRLAKEEIGISFESVKFVGTFNNSKDERGHSFSLLHLCEIKGGPEKNWFSITNFPREMINFQRENFIPKALALFNAE